MWVGLRSGVAFRVQPARGERVVSPARSQVGRVGVLATAGCAGASLLGQMQSGGKRPGSVKEAARRDVPHLRRWLPAREAGARLPAPPCVECGLRRPPVFLNPLFSHP